MPLTRNTLDRFWKVRTASGKSPHTVEYPVTSNTKIEAGDLVKLSSGALVQVLTAASANSANTSYSNGANILGVAMSSCTTDEANSGAVVQVAIADDNLVIGLRVYNSTGSDAELQDMTIGSTYLPVRWTGASTSVTSYACGTDAGNANALTLIQKSSDSAAADDYGIAYFRVLAARRQV